MAIDYLQQRLASFVLDNVVPAGVLLRQYTQDRPDQLKAEGVVKKLRLIGEFLSTPENRLFKLGDGPNSRFFTNVVFWDDDQRQPDSNTPSITIGELTNQIVGFDLFQFITDLASKVCDFETKVSENKPLPIEEFFRWIRDRMESLRK